MDSFKKSVISIQNIINSENRNNFTAAELGTMKGTLLVLKSFVEKSLLEGVVKGEGFISETVAKIDEKIEQYKKAIEILNKKINADEKSLEATELKAIETQLEKLLKLRENIISKNYDYILNSLFGSEYEKRKELMISLLGPLTDGTYDLPSLFDDSLAVDVQTQKPLTGYISPFDAQPNPVVVDKTFDFLDNARLVEEFSQYSTLDGKIESIKNQIEITKDRISVLMNQKEFLEKLLAGDFKDSTTFEFDGKTYDILKYHINLPESMEMINTSIRSFENDLSALEGGLVSRIFRKKKIETVSKDIESNKKRQAFYYSLDEARKNFLVNSNSPQGFLKNELSWTFDSAYDFFFKYDKYTVPKEPEKYLDYINREINALNSDLSKKEEELVNADHELSVKYAGLSDDTKALISSDYESYKRVLDYYVNRKRVYNKGKNVCLALLKVLSDARKIDLTEYESVPELRYDKAKYQKLMQDYKEKTWFLHDSIDELVKREDNPKTDELVQERIKGKNL